MPLFKIRVETQSASTHYVEADNSDVLKESVLGGENAIDLDVGPSHDGENSTTIVLLEELTPTSVN